MVKEKKTYSRERKFAQKVANIFLGDNEVRVAQGDMNIAFCSVPIKKIWFDFEQVFKGQDMVKEMMDFKGYAFHEILHLKHTMRLAKYDIKRARNGKFDGLIQRLEDGRIETLGVMRYQKLADYLIHAVNTHILKDKRKILENREDMLINTFILLYGRSIYFPDKELIAKIRELIIKSYGKDVVERLEKDIDEYILETSAKKRFELAKALYEFLEKKGIFPKFNEDMNSNIFEEGKELKRLPKELKELAKDFPKLKKRREEIRKDIEGKTPKVDEKKLQEEKDKKEQERKDRIKELKKHLKDKDKEWDDLDREWDVSDKEKQKEIQKGLDKLDQEIDDLQEELDDLTEKKSPAPTNDDKKDLSKNIDQKRQENEELLDMNRDDLEADLKEAGFKVNPEYSDKSFDVDSSMIRNSNKISRGLKKLNTDLKQGYINKQRSGRLNVRNLINRKSHLDIKVFKKWLPSQIKKTKMLVNLFIDGSGSMAGRKWETTLGALWIINEAFNKDDNKIMAYQFSIKYAKIKGYDEKLTRPNFMGNSTYILDSLIDALPHIERYKKANGYSNVLNIVITDGWLQDDKDSVKNVIKQMEDKGHHNVLLNVEFKPTKEYANEFGFKHFMYVANFDDLTPKLIKLFGKLKKSMIKKVVMR